MIVVISRCCQPKHLSFTLSMKYCRRTVRSISFGVAQSANNAKSQINMYMHNSADAINKAKMKWRKKTSPQKQCLETRKKKKRKNARILLLFNQFLFRQNVGDFFTVAAAAAAAFCHIYNFQCWLLCKYPQKSCDWTNLWQFQWHAHHKTKIEHSNNAAEKKHK